MTSLCFMLLTHVMFLAIGWLLLRSDPYRDRRALDSADPWAAHPLGLVLVNIVAFVANQFLGVSLTDGVMLGATAAVLVAAGAWYASWRGTRAPEPSTAASRQPWTRLELLAFSLVPSVFVVLYQPVLWHPVHEFDTFMYHVPFARMIADGHYPEHFGTAYNSAYMAAYPPLFYFLYSVHERLHSEYVTFAAAKFVLVFASASSLGLLWHVGRQMLRLSRMFTCYALIAAMIASLVEVNQQAVTSVYLYAAILYGWRYLRADRRAAPANQDRWKYPGCLSDWNGLVVPGLLLAGVYWANYLGVVLVLAMVAGVVLAGTWLMFKKKQAVPWSRLFALLAVAGVFMLPHPLRNVVHTGNPLFPALLGVFGGPGVTPWWLANRSVYADRPLEATFIVNLFESVNSFAKADTTYGLMFPHACVIYLVGIMSIFERRPKPTQRAMGISLLVFMVLWTLLLRTTATPTGRYLFPMAPVMTLVLASMLQREWRSVSRDTMSVIGGILATAVIVYWYFHRPVSPAMALCFLAAIPVIVMGLGILKIQLPREIRILTAIVALAGFLLWLWTYSMHLPLPNAWVAMTCPAVAAILVLVLRQSPSLRTPAIVLASMLCAIAALAFTTDWTLLGRHYLYPEYSLQWMRTRLPEDAVILTNEGRMWEISQRVITVEDSALEGMYTATSPLSALYALKQAGATHIYYGPEAYLPRMAQQLTLFRPVPGNPFIELLFHHRTGSVWRLVYPRQVLEATSEADLTAPTPESLHLMNRFVQFIAPTLGERYHATWLREMVPASAKLKDSLGQAVGRGDQVLAQQILQQIRDIPDKDADDWQNFGMALLAMRRIDEGYAALKQATLVEPMSFKARLFFAEALKQRGDRASLEACIRELEYCYWISPMRAGLTQLAEARSLLTKATR